MSMLVMTILSMYALIWLLHPPESFLNQVRSCHVAAMFISQQMRATFF